MFPMNNVFWRIVQEMILVQNDSDSSKERRAGTGLRRMTAGVPLVKAPGGG
jgi:hypothetical protein